MTQPPDSATPNGATLPTLEEINELITEFEQYRDRLVNDTLAVAKRAKMPKSSVMSQLEPELAHIDATLESLKQQQATLSAAT